MSERERAAALLKKAVADEAAGRYSAALSGYQEGIQLLLAVKRASALSTEEKQALRRQLEDYIGRAERVKDRVKVQPPPAPTAATTTTTTTTTPRNRQIEIPEGATGFGYRTIFGPYLDDKLTGIAIRDPYIRAHHQLYNLLHFCEVAVLGAPNLKKIFLLTSKNNNNRGEVQSQEEGLAELAKSLRCRQPPVELVVSFAEDLHDREIRFNNGWVIKVGRGLDYFQRLDGRFALGRLDSDLRPCRRTTVDVLVKETLLEDAR